MRIGRRGYDLMISLRMGFWRGEGLVNDVRLAESNDTLIVSKKRQGANVGCTIYSRVCREWSRN